MEKHLSVLSKLLETQQPNIKIIGRLGYRLAYLGLAWLYKS